MRACTVSRTWCEGAGSRTGLASWGAGNYIDFPAGRGPKNPATRVKSLVRRGAGHDRDVFAQAGQTCSVPDLYSPLPLVCRGLPAPCAKPSHERAYPRVIGAQQGHPREQEGDARDDRQKQADHSGGDQGHSQDAAKCLPQWTPSLFSADVRATCQQPRMPSAGGLPAPAGLARSYRTRDRLAASGTARVGGQETPPSRRPEHHR